MDPNMLSTFDTVTDAKTPILHKILPGLRAMMQYVSSEWSPHLLSTGSVISRLASPPGGGAARASVLSRLETLFRKTALTLNSKHANRSIPLPRLNLQTPNRHLLLLPPLVDRPSHRRRRLLLGRKIRRLALPGRREIILFLWQSSTGLWIRRAPQRVGIARGH